MATSKSVLSLLRQSLHSSSPCRTLSLPASSTPTPPPQSVRAAIRQLHHQSRATAPQSRVASSVSTWRYRSAVSSPRQQDRNHSSSSSSSAPPSASPATQDGKQLPTLSELEQQRATSRGPKSQAVDVSGPKPEYLLQFTCKKCSERSTHKVSKQAYHGGTVLVQCPGCKVRHLVADHLGIFSDQRVTLEDIMAGKGETIRKGKAELKFAPNGDGVMEVQKDDTSA